MGDVAEALARADQAVGQKTPIYGSTTLNGVVFK